MNHIERMIVVALAAFALQSSQHANAADITGELRQWHTITLTFDGPVFSEQGMPSPFTDCEFTVWFIHPETTQRYEVPGFFAADGNAAETSAVAGNKWRARFSPSLTGRWTCRAELRQFHEVGETVSLLMPGGEFTIAESNKAKDDFRYHGHLRYVGERYLQFAGSGKYFLKAGVDSPETLLGYADFDGTWRDLEEHPVPAPHNPIDLPSLEDGLHRYPDHVGDWHSGDPSWQGDKGKGLIGGLNYLADQSVNSAYFLTMNVNGDRRNVRGPGAYGFNWWVNGGENRMPGAPPRTFYASGLHHNLLFVIPEWNMVIVRMGTDGNPPFGKHNVWNHFLRRVGEAQP